MKKRSSARLVYDLLKVIGHKGLINTRSLMAANLSHEMQKQYVEKIIKEGLIRQTNLKDKDRIIWELSNKGYEYIYEYNAFIKKYPFLGE